MQPDFAAYVATVHNHDGGCTVHPERGDMAGRHGYAVAVFPDRTEQVTGASLAVETVAAYVERNTDALAVGSVAVGTWFDGTTTWIDLSAVVPNKRIAVRLGRRYNQVAVWDLQHSAEVPCGGTGAAPANLPPAGERLAI